MPNDSDDSDSSGSEALVRDKSWKERGRSDTRKHRKKDCKRTKAAKTARYKKKSDRRKAARATRRAALTEAELAQIARKRQASLLMARKARVYRKSTPDRPLNMSLQERAALLATPAVGGPRAGSRTSAKASGRSRTTVMRLRQKKTWTGKKRGRARKITTEERAQVVAANEELRERNGPGRRLPKRSRAGSKGAKKTRATTIQEVGGLVNWSHSESAARRVLKEDAGAQKRPARKRTGLDLVDEGKALKYANFVLDTLWPQFLEDSLIHIDCKGWECRTSLRSQFLRNAPSWHYRSRKDGKRYDCSQVAKVKRGGSGPNVRVFAAAGAGRVLVWEPYTAWNTKVYEKMLTTLRKALLDQHGWSSERLVFLQHDNDSAMKPSNAAACAVRAKLNFRLIQQPPNCPRLQAWDYGHWDTIEAIMLQEELEAGGLIDYKALMGSVNPRTGYVARLKQVALGLREDVVNKTHGSLWRRCEAIVQYGHTRFEDGCWRTPEQRKLKRIRRSVKQIRFGKQYDTVKWAQAWRKKQGVADSDADARIATLKAALEGLGDVLPREQSLGVQGSDAGPKQGGSKRRKSSEKGSKRAKASGSAEVQGNAEGSKQGGSKRPNWRKPPAPPGSKGQKRARTVAPGPESARLPGNLVPRPLPPAEIDHGNGRMERATWSLSTPTYHPALKKWEYRGGVQLAPDGKVYTVKTERERVGYDEVETVGDGSCLFHSCSPFVNVAPGALREAVAGQICVMGARVQIAGGDRFGNALRRVLAGPQERTIPKEIRAAVREAGGAEDAPLAELRQIYAAWLLQKRANGTYKTWGSHFEIGLIAHLYDRTIFVHRKAGGPRRSERRWVELGSPVGAGPEEILLLYCGGCHYNYLVLQ